MVVFNPNDEIHSLRCIPRAQKEVVILKLRNELKDTIETFEIDSFISGNYLILEFEKTFVEGESSEIEIFEGNHTQQHKPTWKILNLQKEF
jgi:hypothetical protein